jgi:exoribonuclease II
MSCDMSVRTGVLLEFFAGDALRLGMVTGQAKGKLRVTDSNGRQHSIAEKHVLLEHEEPADVTRIASAAGALLERIEEIQEEVDTELLWSGLKADGKRDYTAEELAAEYFGEASCCRASAMLRAILDDSPRFKFRAGRILPRPADQVDAQMRGRLRREKREARLRRVRAWLHRLLVEREAGEDLEESEREVVVRRLEDFLLQRQRDDEVADWLDNLDPELPPRMAAYDALAALGRLPASADPLLMAAGIDSRFSREALAQAAALAPFTGSPNRIVSERESTFAIDDEDTREIDDAFSVEADAEGIAITVHIADLTPFVAKSDALDEEARRRISTVYLPQTTVRMFPENLSCDLASLREGELRPSLSLRARFSPGCELLDWELIPSEIVVGRHLSYDEADHLLESPESGRLAEKLAEVKALTDGLVRRRASSGALLLNRPELKIVVRKECIILKVVDPNSPSRRLVGELMILVNHLSGRFAVERSIPFIFRGQPPPAEKIEIPEGYDPFRLNQIFAQLERSRLSSRAEPHAGLGLECYTQLTSPIRRYGDLVLQRQLMAAVRGEASVYTPDELLEIMGTVQSVDRELRAAERKANRYYVLTYLERNLADETVLATVLRTLDRGYLIETRDLYVRGLLDYAGELQPGADLQVRIDRVDPGRNVLVYRAA